MTIIEGADGFGFNGLFSSLSPDNSWCPWNSPNVKGSPIGCSPNGFVVQNGDSPNVKSPSGCGPFYGQIYIIYKQGTIYLYFTILDFQAWSIHYDAIY